MVRAAFGRWPGLLLAAASVLGLLAACDKTKASADAPTAPVSSRPESTPTPPPVASASTPSPAKPATHPNEATENMPTAEKTNAIAAGSNAFAFDLWARTRKRANGNFAFSPASISMAFAMTYGGAKGETAAQMKKVFHFPEEPEALMRSWGGLGRALSDPGRPTKLRVANRLFGEKTYGFEPTYLDRTRAAFGAALEPVDFKNAPDPARLQINAWVEDQTEKRIKDLLPAGSIKPLTRMVLVNAIYFLGNWERQFDEKRTRDEPFHTSAATTKQAPMMHQTNYFAAAQVGGVKVLELAYKGDSASFLVVLPEKVDDLPAVEASLSSAIFDSWKRAVKGQTVAVTLPRFELNPSSSLPLSAELTALGMPIAFDRAKADFSAMGNPTDPNERLSIDEAFHKAFVKVDEKGTEAAAATAVVMTARGGPPPKPFEFKADHPFLFFVLDKASGLVLFIGRVTEP
jgi:serpin B